MNKKLNIPCHEAEIIFDKYWKVIIKYMDKEKYYYIFDTEAEAINKFNELK